MSTKAKKEVKDHPLNSNWRFYLQTRDQGFDKYTKFDEKDQISTVESFWQWWNELHKFEKKNDSISRLKKSGLKIFIMRNDILPEWEHAGNRGGGILTLTCTMPKKKTVDVHEKDVYNLWLASVLSMIGEMFFIDEKDYDKMKPSGISLQFGKYDVASIKIWFGQVWWNKDMEETMDIGQLPVFIQNASKTQSLFPTIVQHKFD